MPKEKCTAKGGIQRRIVWRKREANNLAGKSSIYRRK